MIPMAPSDELIGRTHSCKIGIITARSGRGMGWIRHGEVFEDPPLFAL